MEIKRTKDLIEKDKSSQMHTVAKMKDLSRKVMANFVTRAHYFKISKGFYTWLEYTKEYNRVRRFMRKCVVYMMKRGLQKGFRTWANNIYEAKIDKLSRDLHDVE